MNYRTTPVHIDVDVEIYPGLVLDGEVMASINAERVIDNQQVRAKNANGELVEIDWDDLSDKAQESIDMQILAHFDSMAHAA